MPVPQTHRSAVVDTYHGTQVADPYRWLEDPHDEQTQAWVAEQSAHAESYLATCPARDRIRQRLRHLWNYERVSTPIRRGDRLFFLANDGLQEQSVLYVQDVCSGVPRVLLDANTLSDDGTVSLSSWSVSPDGSRLAWATSDGGSDWNTWRVRDVQTAQDLDDIVHWSKFSGAAWAPDASGFFYSRYPAPANPLEQVSEGQWLAFHRIGTPEQQDVRVYDNPQEPTWGFSPQVRDGVGLLTIWRGTEAKNLLYQFDPNDPQAAPTPIVDDWNASYTPIAAKDGFVWLLTDHDAVKNRVVRLSMGEHHEAETVIAEAEHLLESAHIIGDRLLLVYMVNATSQVRVASIQGELLGELRLPGIGTAGGFQGSAEHQHGYFWFTRFTHPTTVFRVDPSDLSCTPFRTPQVDFDPDAYTTKQVRVTSKDGTIVRLFLSYRNDLEFSGDCPTVLYGYGGFNIPITPTFSPKTIVWMDMGGIWASANLRGGGEYGRQWYEAGTRERKQNVFDDFIACAEFLCEKQYTNSQRLAIQGRSNGGLLVGATLLQRPELFAAALPGVGVLDMLRYHHFTIGWAWASDYGTSDEADMFPHLMAYSPVHNAIPAEYPATMVMTADHDDRVVPAHSFKFTAALQYAQQGPAPILARIETRAGHGAGKSLSMVIDEATDEKAFLVNALDMDVSRFCF